MSHQIMTCKRDSDRADVFSVTGSYSAPPGPAWRWRISLQAGSDSEDRMVLRMFNIPPEEDEALAVEAVYSRTR